VDGKAVCKVFAIGFLRAPQSMMDLGLLYAIGSDLVAYLYKMAPVARIQIAPPLKYLKLCLSLFGFGFRDINFLIL
jgi:hypothetical protein